MSTTRNLALMLGAAAAGYWLLKGRKTSEPFDYRGKVALVTGSSRGLGLILARKLAAAGARVAICARDADELARARDDVAGYGPPPLAVPCDLADPDQAQRLVERVERELGPIDVLINNAGIIGVGPQETMTLDDYRKAMDVNFFAAVHAVHHTLPSMQRRKTGRIVNVTSIGGKVAIPHLLPYTASKFALVGLSQGLRSEVAKDGVTVTTVVPGLMRTGSPRNATFKGQHQAEYAWFAISDSLPGLSMDADEAAGQILEACTRGDAEVTLGLPAKAGALFHDLFPGLTADVLGFVNQLLPAPGGIGTASRLGKESESEVSRSALTEPSQRAAERNNEIAPAER